MMLLQGLSGANYTVFFLICRNSRRGYDCYDVALVTGML